MKRSRSKSKLRRMVVEVPLLKDNAALNLEEGISANRGNPYVGSQMSRNASEPVKFVMGVLALYIIFGLGALLAVALYFYLI